MILSVSLSAPQVRQGRLKALAIPGRSRASRLPEVPSAAEAGYPEFEALLFSSLHAPAGTPQPVIARMSAELGKAVREPDTRKRMEELGAVPAVGTPEEFARYLRGVGRAGASDPPARSSQDRSPSPIPRRPSVPGAPGTTARSSPCRRRRVPRRAPSVALRDCCRTCARAPNIRSTRAP
jgi:hypothetical protein